MRRSASEKMELIDLVERTDLPVRVTLRQLGIPPSTFYGWYRAVSGRRLRCSARQEAAAASEVEQGP